MNGKQLLALLVCTMLFLSFSACLFQAEEVPSQPVESEQTIDPEYPVVVNGTQLDARPARVISLSPSLTEKLADLGFAERLAGVSDYCDYPGELSALPRCGTAQLPALEEIGKTDAHLLVCEAELAQEDRSALEEMGITVVVLERANSVEQLKETYTNLARLLEGAISGEKIGHKFADDFQQKLDALSAYSAYAEQHGRKKAVYLRMLDYTVATGDTLENELMEHIGLYNIAREQTGWLYPRELAEAAEGRQAFEALDIIYCDESIVSIAMLEQSPYYKSLQAVLKDRYLYIDSTLFERQSLRMLEVLEQMAAYAYPEAKTGAPPASGEEAAA